MRRSRGPRTAVIAAVALALGACSTTTGGPTAEDPASAVSGREAATGTGTASGGGAAAGADEPSEVPDLASFCTIAQPATVPVAREAVGSAEHVALLDSVADAARTELGDESLGALLSALADYFETSVNPTDPRSQNFENFPSAVQEDALQVQASLDDLC